MSQRPAAFFLLQSRRSNEVDQENLIFPLITSGATIPVAAESDKADISDSSALARCSLQPYYSSTFKAAILILLLVLGLIALANAADPLTVSTNGLISGRIALPESSSVRALIDLGLPAVPASKHWAEGEVLSTLWETNGIRYTEQVLVTVLEQKLITSEDPDGSIPVLLVSIEGNNTNGEYTEGFASLKMEVNRSVEELEFQSGSLWRRFGDERRWLGILEIAEAGVRVARGQTLCFGAAIPPSLKGSMTLKIPLRPLKEAKFIEMVEELDFDELARQARKRTRTSNSQASATVPQVQFAAGTPTVSKD